MTHPHNTSSISIAGLLIDPLTAILDSIAQPQLPGFEDPIRIHLATLGEMLYGDQQDLKLMTGLARLRQYEDDLEEELRDPESPHNQGYVLIVGSRAYPIARLSELLKDKGSPHSPTAEAEELSR